MNLKPLTPILEWLIEEQAGLLGKDIANLAEIAPATWSKVRQGKQDLSSDLIWRVMGAIATLRPRSVCAEVVQVIEGKNFHLGNGSVTFSISRIIECSTDEELDEMMTLLVRQIFLRARKKTESVLPL